MSAERAVVLAMMVANGLVLTLIERRAGPLAMRASQRARPVGPNLALTALLLILNGLLDRLAAAAGFRHAGGLLDLLPLASWAKGAAVVVALDGFAYLAHVSMHRVPAAWRFHRVHHSDIQVDVTTAFRQHPFETVWRYSFLAAAVGALGPSPRSVAVYLALSALNAQLEHADVVLPSRVDRALRFLVATPAMHRVHHSRTQAETDTNYSNILSIWDRLFGTYRVPRAGERVAVGLDHQDAPGRQRTAGLLALPFA